LKCISNDGMKKGHENIEGMEQLIGKYLSGETSREEVLKLEIWVKESEENSKMFLQIRQSWNLAAIDLSSEKINVDREWASFVSNNIDKEKIISLDKGDEKSRRKFILAIAAAILLLTMALVWMLGDEMINGEEIFSTGEMVSIEKLSDGSIISLNRNSKLNFDNSQQRRAILKGDAFFEVRPDEGRAFVVEAKELEIRVLGTSFYVDAKENKEDVKVIVNTGKVAVKHLNDSLVLVKGQMAIFNRSTKELKRSEVRDVNYLSWKTKALVFQDMSLQEVVTKLEEVYGREIELEQHLRDCKITVSFRDQELEAVLSVILTTLNLSIIEKDKSLLLSGKSCN